MEVFTDEEEKWFREQKNKFNLQLNKKKINSQLFKCNSCNLEKKRGSFRSISNLICIECEKLKYKGKKLPKVKKQPKENNIAFDKIKLSSFAGVYKITCKVNSKVYIGETSNLRRRHSNYVLRDGYINPNLLKDIAQYGINNFNFQVLALMKGSTKEDRLSVEYHYKQQYALDSLYNILPGIESKEEYQKLKEIKTSDNKHQSIQS